jgi:hypothetical protein
MKEGPPKQSAEHDRWQDKRIEQLGFSINLILTLSFGALLYTLNEMTESHDLLFMAMGAPCLFVSGLCGVVACVTRLCDFRYMAEREHTQPRKPKDSLKRLTDTLGKATWLLFWFELGLFALGIACVSISALRIG